MSDDAAAPRPRLLVVEADESVRRVLVRALCARYEVTPLATLKSALMRLREETFDLALVDRADILEQIRADAPALPLVHIAKPFDRKTLLAALTPR